MSRDLYSEHFGFSERPFTLLPDPDFLYWSRAHTRAYTVLEYGLMTHAPLTVLTGEVGTGKTTLIQALLRRTEEEMTVGLISNAQGGRGDLLRWVLNSLNIPSHPSGDYVELFQQLQDFVISEYSDGRHVVLIIDEAQNLTAEVLEELRMLTNINSGKDELLQMILLGQPELREMITRPELRQFAQRVTATYHLDPMDLETTLSYVNHRLIHVGGTGAEITEQAVAMVHEISAGVPRMINKICDLAFVYTAAAGEGTVSSETVKEVARDQLILPNTQAPYYLTNPINSSSRKAAE
ncbi:AAA family ATPase [Sulfitobacter sp.]|uniref:ExeA family protein n=1 Tax=Sulfitobacter sp. TaxID=1903071 RepID=UPI003294A127